MKSLSGLGQGSAGVKEQESEDFRVAGCFTDWSLKVLRVPCCVSF